MAIWPWFSAIVLQNGYNASDFLQVASYKNVIRWREAARRGRIVNTTSGPEDRHLRERHDASDFVGKNLDYLVM